MEDLGFDIVVKNLAIGIKEFNKSISQLEGSMQQIENMTIDLARTMNKFDLIVGSELAVKILQLKSITEKLEDASKSIDNKSNYNIEKTAKELEGIGKMMNDFVKATGDVDTLLQKTTVKIGEDVVSRAEDLNVLADKLQNTKREPALGKDIRGFNKAAESIASIKDDMVAITAAISIGTDDMYKNALKIADVFGIGIETKIQEELQRMIEAVKNPFAAAEKEKQNYDNKSIIDNEDKSMETRIDERMVEIVEAIKNKAEMDKQLPDKNPHVETIEGYIMEIKSIMQSTYSKSNKRDKLEELIDKIGYEQDVKIGQIDRGEEVIVPPETAEEHKNMNAIISSLYELQNIASNSLDKLGGNIDSDITSNFFKGGSELVDYMLGNVKKEERNIKDEKELIDEKKTKDSEWAIVREGSQGVSLDEQIEEWLSKVNQIIPTSDIFDKFNDLVFSNMDELLKDPDLYQDIDTQEVVNMLAALVEIKNNMEAMAKTNKDMQATMIKMASRNEKTMEPIADKEADAANKLVEEMLDKTDVLSDKSEIHQNNVLEVVKYTSKDMIRIMEEFANMADKKMTPIDPRTGSTANYQQYRDATVNKDIQQADTSVMGKTKAMKALQSVSGVVEKVVGGIKGVIIRGAQKAAATVQGVVKKMIGSINQLINPFAKKEKSIIGQLLGIGGLGYMTKKALSGIRGFVKDSLQIASDMEETKNVVDTVFQGTEDRIKKFSESSMKYLGLSSLQTEQFASTYKSMLSSVEGLDQGFTTHMAQMMTGLAADVGSFYSATMDTKQAFETLKAPLDRQSLKIAKLGVNMTQSAMADWAGTQGFDYMKADMQSQTLLRLAYVFEKLQMTAGDFYRNQMSFHNQLELIKNKLLEIKGIFGAMFVDVIKPILQYINVFLDIILNKADILINFFYRLAGIQRPSEKDNKEFKPVPAPLDEGMLSAMDSDRMNDGDKDDEKKKKGKELDLLSMDSIEMLKTDYSDPEKEKDRKQGREQFNAIAALLEKNMNQRESSIEDIKKKMEGNLNKASERVINRLDETFEKYKPIFDKMFDLIIQFVDTIKQIVGPVKDGMAAGFEKYNLKGIIDNSIDTMSSILEKILGVGFGGVTRDEDGNITKNVFNTIGEIIALIIVMRIRMVGIVLELIDHVLGILEETGLLADIGVMTQSFLEKIWIAIENAVDLLKEILSSVFGKISEIKDNANKLHEDGTVDKMSELATNIETLKQERSETKNPIEKFVKTLQIGDNRIESKFMKKDYVGGMFSKGKYQRNLEWNAAMNKAVRSLKDRPSVQGLDGTLDSKRYDAEKLNLQLTTNLDGRTIHKAVEEVEFKKNRMTGLTR